MKSSSRAWRRTGQPFWTDASELLLGRYDVIDTHVVVRYYFYASTAQITHTSRSCRSPEDEVNLFGRKGLHYIENFGGALTQV